MQSASLVVRRNIAANYIRSTTTRAAAGYDRRCMRKRMSTRPAYDGHIPLNWFENAFLATGSAIMSLADPRRGGVFSLYSFFFSFSLLADMVAALGETTAGPVLTKLRDAMLESDEGRRILKQRPRINTTTIDMKTLSELPHGTFGRSYITWLERCGVTPDSREPVSRLLLIRLVQI